MAEFCLECWNKINGTNNPESMYVMSDELGFCEECGEIKSVVVMEKNGLNLINRFCYVYSLVHDILSLPKILYHRLKRK